MKNNEGRLLLRPRDLQPLRLQRGEEAQFGRRQIGGG